MNLVSELGNARVNEVVSVVLTKFVRGAPPNTHLGFNSRAGPMATTQTHFFMSTPSAIHHATVARCKHPPKIRDPPFHSPFLRRPRPPFSLSTRQSSGLGQPGDGHRNVVDLAAALVRVPGGDGPGREGRHRVRVQGQVQGGGREQLGQPAAGCGAGHPGGGGFCSRAGGKVGRRGRGAVKSSSIRAAGGRRREAGRPGAEGREWGSGREVPTAQGGTDGRKQEARRQGGEGGGGPATSSAACSSKRLSHTPSVPRTRQSPASGGPTPHCPTGRRLSGTGRRAVLEGEGALAGALMVLLRCLMVLLGCLMVL